MNGYKFHFLIFLYSPLEALHYLILKHMDKNEVILKGLD